MAFELIHTSVPKGLRRGSQGYCTVAYTHGTPANYVELCEDLSFYNACYRVSDPQYAKNPTAHSHYRVTVGGQDLSVLSRIACYTPDYSGRSNYLAHHLVADPAIDLRPEAGPAALLATAAGLGLFRREWNGVPQTFPQPALIPDVKGPVGPAATWRQLAGDAGWAGALAQHALEGKGAPACIIFEPRDLPDPEIVIQLVAEALALLPASRRWEVTFSTYFQRLSPKSTCLWRCCAAKDAEPIAAIRRTPGALVLDLTGGPLGTATGELAECARSGHTPDGTRIGEPTAAQPPVTAPQVLFSPGWPRPATALANARTLAPAAPRPLTTADVASMATQVPQPRARPPRRAVVGVLCLVVLLLGGMIFLVGRNRPPNAPPNLKATAPRPAEADLAWTATATTGAGYSVERASDVGVTPGVAVPESGRSLPSDAQTVTTPPSDLSVPAPLDPSPPVPVFAVIPDKLTRDIRFAALRTALGLARVPTPADLSFAGLTITLVVGGERMELGEGTRTRARGIDIEEDGVRFRYGANLAVDVFPDGLRTPAGTGAVIFESPGQWRVLSCPREVIAKAGGLMTTELSPSNPDITCQLGDVWEGLGLLPEEKRQMDALLWDPGVVTWSAELEFTPTGIWFTPPAKETSMWAIERTREEERGNTVFRVVRGTRRSAGIGSAPASQTLDEAFGALEKELRNQYANQAFSANVRDRLEAVLGEGNGTLARLADLETRIERLRKWLEDAEHRPEAVSKSREYDEGKRVITKALSARPEDLEDWEQFHNALWAACRRLSIPQVTRLHGRWAELRRLESERRAGLRKLAAEESDFADRIEKMTRLPMGEEQKRNVDRLRQQQAERQKKQKEVSDAFYRSIEDKMQESPKQKPPVRKKGTEYLDNQALRDIGVALLRYGDLTEKPRDEDVARRLEGFAGGLFVHQQFALRPEKTEEKRHEEAERQRALNEALNAALAKGWMTVTVREVTCRKGTEARGGPDTKGFLRLTPPPPVTPADGGASGKEAGRGRPDANEAH